VTFSTWVLLCLLSSQDSWRAVWADLESVRAGRLVPAEAELVLGRLREAASAGDSGPRVELLRAELDALSGLDVSGRVRPLADLQPFPFEGPELWFLADLMPGGARRQELVLSALGATPELASWQVLVAWDHAVEEARSQRFDSALPIQEELHRRYQADWSLTDLALTYRQLGRRQQLEALFEEALQRAPSADLWSQYAIATQGAGDERRARDYLGRALALGSKDASQVLARMDLVAGHREAARAGFRILILETPPPDWAWRGWGLTLLPDAFAPAVTIPSQTPHE